MTTSPDACALATVGHWVNFTGIKRALGSRALPCTIVDTHHTTVVVVPEGGGTARRLTTHLPAVALARRVLETGSPAMVLYDHAVASIGDFWLSYLESEDLSACEASVRASTWGSGPMIHAPRR